MILSIVAIVLAMAVSVAYLGIKIQLRRYPDAFIDGWGIFPWPVLISLGFFFIAALAKIWSPEGDTAKRWARAGLIQGSATLGVAWFLRFVLFAAPESLAPAVPDPVKK